MLPKHRTAREVCNSPSGRPSFTGSVFVAGTPMDFELNVAESVAIGVGLGLVVCVVTCIICRIWRRNRYYSKVQKTLDDEERAFQE